LRKRLPRKNTMVRTKQGIGKVIDTQIITQLVVVEYEDGKKAAFVVDDIEMTDVKPEAAARPDQTDKPDEHQVDTNQDVDADDDMYGDNDQDDEKDNQ
jgi:hypothetical protein